MESDWADTFERRVISGMGTICHCEGHLRDGSSANANARLIAAAPDLLAALRNAVRYMRSSVDVGRIPPDDPELLAAEAAIAKATE